MERECEECRTLEHNIYWTHFQSIHFCQILNSDFRFQLKIPKKFSDYARGRLQDKVILKGPNGTTTWEVMLKTNNDMLFIGDGWTELVNAFSLEENDILIFKYNGNSRFSVMFFDGETMCEKESSYFIRRCSHFTAANKSKEKGFLKEVLAEFAQEYSSPEFELAPQKKPRKDPDNQNWSPLEQCIDVDAVEERPGSQQKSSWTLEPVKLPPAAQISRSTVMEKEKEVALSTAKKELTANSFLVIMRPSCVSGAFYLNIPKAWMNQHLKNFKHQLVRLRTNGKSWPVKLQCRSNGRAGLSLGWKAFVLENCLEESDVCVFKPDSEKQDPLILEVSIFRVVPVAVRSIPVAPAGNKVSELSLL